MQSWRSGEVDIDLLLSIVDPTPLADPVLPAAPRYDLPAAGVALVLVNFLLAAGTISVTARISLALMMGAVLGGYLVRLGLILVAVLLVKDAGWISRPALGATIIVTHIGLLAWELKYVALSLAHPGLKPARKPN